MALKVFHSQSCLLTAVKTTTPYQIMIILSLQTVDIVMVFHNICTGCVLGGFLAGWYRFELN